MPVKVKVSGAWKDAVPKVKVSGAWKDVSQKWGKVSGVWELFYELITSIPWSFVPQNGKPQYSGSSKNVTSEESEGVNFLSFKPDGTKMYVGGSAYGTVFQYTLSTPWEPSTASYDSVSLDNSGQEDDIYSGYFKPDGTELYLTASTNTGSTDSISQYTLSSAWDLSTASYTNDLDISTEVTSPVGTYIKPDGSRLYVTDRFSAKIYEYDLATNWDISTATYNSVSIALTISGPAGLYFKDDGSALYIAYFDSLRRYNLSTNWDLSTTLFSEDVYSTRVEGQTAGADSIFFKPDGLSVYFGNSSDDILKHDLNAAWDLYSFSNDIDIASSSNLVINAQTLNATAFSFDDIGTKIYLCDFEVDGNSQLDGINIYQYTLSTAWDLSTATYDAGGDLALGVTNLGNVWSISFKNDGTTMYLLDSDNLLRSYSLSIAWDTSTATDDSVYLDMTAEDSVPSSVYFKPDGSVLFVVGATNDSMYEWSMSTNWDISTATYEKVQDFDDILQTPVSLVFKPDGTRIFIRCGEIIHQIELLTGWNIFTEKYSSIKYKLGVDTDDMQFRTDNGESFYVLSRISQRIYQYDI